MKRVVLPGVLFSLTAACAANAFQAAPTGRYLAVPVENGAPKVKLEIFDGTARVTYATVEWARAATNLTGSLDLNGFKGRPLEFRFSGETAKNFSAADLVFADSRFPAPAGQFDEPYRPQLHFTPPIGWCNDPNGLSWYNGEWHLFYQCNPFGAIWGNMHWGHAVSKDLVHWTDLGTALAPDDHGTAFSGSAVVDTRNTAGFGKGAHVLLYTAARFPFTQRLAWSLDGRTYTKWPHAAVKDWPSANRDPKVLWYAPGGHWVMLVYGEVEKNRHGLAVYASKNLKDWKRTGTILGDRKERGYYLYECPDLFEVPIAGEKGTRWVLTGADRQYAIGTFDGCAFHAEAERLSQFTPLDQRTPVYAWQTFSGVPDGRCIQIAWTRFETLKRGVRQAMFSQGMTLPVELSLVRTPLGLRLARQPARELRALRDGPVSMFRPFDGELAEVEVTCQPMADGVIQLNLRGVKIDYYPSRRILTVNGKAVAWELDADGLFKLRVFIDRVGLEIFSFDGLQYLPCPDVIPDPSNRKLTWRLCGVTAPARHFDARAWRLRRAVGGARP